MPPQQNLSALVQRPPDPAVLNSASLTVTALSIIHRVISTPVAICPF